MSQQLSQANLGTATPSPRIRRNPSTESPLDETSCTLCDCSEFRMGKVGDYLPMWSSLRRPRRPATEKQGGITHLIVMTLSQLSQYSGGLGTIVLVR